MIYEMENQIDIEATNKVYTITDREEEDRNNQLITQADSTQDLYHEHHVGDILVENKPTGTIRIYCINLNGLKWDQEGGKWPDICQAMEACNADIVGLVELNQDVGRYELQNKLNSICKATFQQHQLIMSTSNHRVCKTYKPGGTAVMVCNNMTTLLHSWNRDRMGRWTSIRIMGPEGKYITYIMAYQVCSTITKGTNTAAAQQRATLMTESIAMDTMDRSIYPRSPSSGHDGAARGRLCNPMR